MHRRWPYPTRAGVSPCHATRSSLCVLLPVSPLFRRAPALPTIRSARNGDGAGRFTSKAVFTHRQSFLALSAADMNDDGRSDLVGGDTDESVHVFFSRAGRSFSEKAIPASAVQIPLLSYYPPILADFDGNGRKDIVFVVESSTNSSSVGVRGLYQLAAGSFSPGPYAEADTFTIDLERRLSSRSSAGLQPRCQAGCRSVHE
jgi:FG-GAP-like repeat